MSKKVKKLLKKAFEAGIAYNVSVELGVMDDIIPFKMWYKKIIEHGELKKKSQTSKQQALDIESVMPCLDEIIDFANDRMINHRRSGKMEIVLIDEKTEFIAGAIWAKNFAINKA